MSLGLYLHVPFCTSICNYCNFNRGLFDQEVKGRYVDALAEEIRVAGDGSPADTIFFGGGTPSLLDPPEVARLIARCRSGFDVPLDAEVTLEANPETLTLERLTGFREAGVTRLSVGVQSLQDGELHRLGRLHSAAKAREALAAARRAGFGNVSLDLMMWLPKQTVADWMTSVDEAAALGPDHLSLYLLELYPNAPLRDEMARRQWSLAPDDDAAEMYLMALERLDRAGYRQYEISNVARPGCEARHNLKYWSDGEWLGFGCGAHSTRRGVRWKNRSATEEYIAAVRGGGPLRTEERHLTAEERLEEALFTGLRLTAGVDRTAFALRYGVDPWERYGEALEPFVDQGLLVHGEGHVRLTREGMLLSHEIMVVFIGRAVR
ncbi:MAG: radical SAM family heme chaperone HemW [Acidimicrobiia bacterium]|nr:radical SAM family heme chaperone HemW [Acidimicrobiia bacterium]